MIAFVWETYTLKNNSVANLVNDFRRVKQSNNSVKSIFLMFLN
jgi:hypothetical protein